MNRYWVSWWSNYCAKCKHKDYPIQVWISGQSANDDEACKHGTDRASICAVIDTDKDEEYIFSELKKYTPDLEPRFCNLDEPDFVPGNRFPNFENRTRLE